MNIEKDYDGTELTTLKTPFKVKYFVQPNSPEELKELRSIIKKKSVPILILGKGSNTVFVESKYDGMIISTLKINDKLFEINPDTLNVGSGYPITRGVNWSFQNHDWAFIPWIGIPGTVGGAVAMNAGTSLGQSSSVIRQVTYFNLVNNIVDTTQSLQWAYRRNLFLRPFEIILWASIQRSPMTESQIEDAKNFLIKRKNTQPIQFPNCGSVFKNPPSIAAGKLIEESGLKGFVVGGAQISELHGNFIINQGDASGKDIANLIYAAQEKVFHFSGIHLEPEVKIIHSNDFLPITIPD